MREAFEQFMSQLQETNQTLEFFSDFEKISNNVDNIKLSLCMLNSLIGTTDLRRSVETIWQRDPSVFQIMDILIAVRGEGRKKVLTKDGLCIEMTRLFESVEGVVEFIRETGLEALFQDRRITNLVDYVFGIETGLDSNARKNRSGHIMEDTVASIFRAHDIAFRQEVYSKEWPELQHALGDDEKRFDFVIESRGIVYLIEVNFYSGGGSKLNEVARSYSEIAPKVNSLNGFEFVWITDGIGWKSARNKLQEAYAIIPRIYNLTTVDDFIKELK
jgi:type II restriction enzyme